MRHDFPEAGSVSIAFKQAQERESQKMQALMSQMRQDVYSKPDAEPPVLQIVAERLAQISASLGGASTRIETVTDRVLGTLPQQGGSSNGDTAGAPACSAASLLRLIDGIALQVERLHDVASRVERIG